MPASGSPQLLHSDDFSDEVDDDDLIAISAPKPTRIFSDVTDLTNGDNELKHAPKRDALVSSPKVLASPSRFFERRSQSSLPTSSPLASSQSSVEEVVRPTHHALNYLNTHNYLYPTNLPLRDYQVNIVRKALFENVLCALPTGLGKTFIASTVMLNWYRWTKTAKVIFVAPTRPLVAQQIEACLGMTGIPEKDASVLVSDGPLTPAAREEEWNSKRVFFATPQTVQNDLKSGKLDPKSIVCLVVDEAHRATGNHAYVDVVNLISRSNDSFRILALTATPSGNIEGVQEIISNLKISRVEIRTESSIDIQKYVHKRNVNRIKVEETDDQKAILEHLGSALTPLLSEVNQAKVYYVTDPKNITQFGVLKALKVYNASDAARSQSPMVFKIRAIMSILIKMGHAIHLLKIHGIRPFYEYIEGMRAEATGENGSKKKKQPGKYVAQLIFSEGFIECIDICKRLIFGDSSDTRLYYIGHAKLQELVDIVNDFFTASMAEPDSRAIIFAEYRESAAEIIRVLEYYCPTAKPSLFIGQATNGKPKTSTSETDENGFKNKSGSSGMRQKEQRRVVEAFKTGELNTLVATSIGEEGLDIGQVDLIICYDQSKSPIRILQRMGRTGRKRAGNIYMLMTEQEETKIDHAFDGYKYIQREINKNERFEYAERNRILPAVLKPSQEQMFIEIPKENKELLEAGNVDKRVEAIAKMASKGRLPKKKASAKKFFMPANVTTGFVTARDLSKTDTLDLNNLPTQIIGETDLKRSHADSSPTLDDFSKKPKKQIFDNENIDNEFYI
jgi:ATP-dependent DNA helicase MPH1